MFYTSIVNNTGIPVLWSPSTGDPVVIPFCEKRNIIEQSHADKTSAYLGVGETLARIKQKYYWPGIRNDVRSYVASCEPCSKRKCLLQKNRDLMKRQVLGCPVRRCNSQKVFQKIKVITKLPNSEQSYKGKVKTHNYINRQNQSTTGKLWKP